MQQLTRTVRTQFNGEDEAEDIDVVCFPDDVEPARASVSLGGTVNMGNYSSVKFHVSVSLPCYAAEIEAALDEAQRIAGERADQINAEIQEAK